MPIKLKRYQTLGHDHFITFSCYRRQPLLDSDDARTLFLRTLEAVRTRHRFLVHGYVLMPEHVHLLLSEPREHKLAVTLSVLKSVTSKYLKPPNQPLWQVRYYDFNVLTTRKHIEKLRYIHRNPVARGLVANPEDWPWSSYRHWLTGEPSLVEIESSWTLRERESSSHPSR